jgi:hypothetical protein
MLDYLSDQALLMLALVTWHFDATSDIRQLLSQLRHTPDQVLSEAPRILSLEPHHLLVRSLECSDDFMQCAESCMKRITSGLAYTLQQVYS